MTTNESVIVLDLGGLFVADAGVVDLLARWQLEARRCGAHIELRHASSELQELLAFAGLDELVQVRGGSDLEPGRQTEEWEEGLGVEEEVQADDLTI